MYRYFIAFMYNRDSLQPIEHANIVWELDKPLDSLIAIRDLEEKFRQNLNANTVLITNFILLHDE